jgi:hypothetical protein
MAKQSRNDSRPERKCTQDQMPPELLARAASLGTNDPKPDTQKQQPLAPLSAPADPLPGAQQPLMPLEAPAAPPPTTAPAGPAPAAPLPTTTPPAKNE